MSGYSSAKSSLAILAWCGMTPMELAGGSGNVKVPVPLQDAADPSWDFLYMDSSQSVLHIRCVAVGALRG